MKKKERIHTLTIYVLLMAMIFAISGCAGKTDVSEKNPKNAEKAQAKEVVIAQSKDVATMDPHQQSDTETGNVLTGIFDTLLWRATDMSILPSLATEYKKISDSEWEIKLRQGVKFHNGEEFNANAVKFSFDRIIDPKTKALSKPYFSTIEKAEVTDPYTVKFTTNGYDPLFAARLTNFYVLPPKYVQEKGDEYFAKNPVGTGPYKFVKWVKDDRVIMEANPDYFLGKPAIDRIVWRPIPEMATRIAGLQGGQIDIIGSLPSDQVSTIKSNDNIEIVIIPSAMMQMLNFSPTVAPADKKEFRLAVAHAIDPLAIVKGLFGEYATAIDVPISDIIPNAPKDVKRLPYDPEKSKQLLAKIGLGSGVEVEMKSENGKYPLDKEIAQVIAQQLSQVGIKVTVKPTENNQFRDLVQNKSMTPLFLMGGNNVWFDIDPQIVAFYGSKGPLSVYSNKEVDSLINEGRTTKDENMRKEIYSKAFKIIRDDAGGIAILQYKNISAINKKIKWTARPDGRIWAYDIKPR